MDGLSNYPPGGWEKLPNKLLDPEFFNDEEQEDEINLDDYYADLKCDRYLEE
jgi:hypothetical protein